MLSRKNKAEHTAAQAWDYLSSAVATAGDSAKEAGRHTVDVTSTTASRLADQASRRSSKLADQASSRGSKLAAEAGKKGSKLSGKANKKVNKAADEAFARATLAANALSGKKPGLPWGLIIGVGLLGAALGWAAATTARAALERQAENEELELAETAVVVTPTYDN